MSIKPSTERGEYGRLKEANVYSVAWRLRHMTKWGDATYFWVLNCRSEHVTNFLHPIHQGLNQLIYASNKV